MSKITRIDVDLAKNLIQVHAMDASGKAVTNRALKREKFLAWCAELPEGCLVAMEACSGARHWCRKLCERGLDARMISHYALALINPKICGVDNARVLGYDNSHGHSHKHYMGKKTDDVFTSYEDLYKRFQAERMEIEVKYVNGELK